MNSKAFTLSTLILYKLGYDTKSLFSLEEYFDTHPDEYYGNLKRIRSSYDENPNPDLTEWTEFFVHAIETEMTRVESEVKGYLREEDLRKGLKGTARSKVTNMQSASNVPARRLSII